MRSEADIVKTIQTYSDNIRRICFVYLKNDADTEDVFQDVFLKYAQCKQNFENENHVRAWLIRVCINRCKDVLKNSARRNTSIDELHFLPSTVLDDNRETLEAVLALPQKFRTVVYLHYYEGYTAPEISRLIRKNINTVYTWLGRAREKLKQMLGGELGE
ncbi:MAG: sigma-70 family RNA polymerase sigma factor [Christensenella sp.]|uniref:RNA polymerase sigma factor n=1 Tax=Christensenella sp. TaxID=1935934 RepID=UPI002B2150A4|nr:sigma-70 family RNA polymerase sigma factor [Christensenella sp.]MEA5003538.1 sigma-70 family RNA polymerase sigma factor [Christensenella sp.]